MGSQQKKNMDTFILQVVLEPDEDFDGNPAGWHAYAPALVKHGASTWGATADEALANLRDVVELTIASMREHGEPLPVRPVDQHGRIVSEVAFTV